MSVVSLSLFLINTAVNFEDMYPDAKPRTVDANKPIVTFVISGTETDEKLCDSATDAPESDATSA